MRDSDVTYIGIDPGLEKSAVVELKGMVVGNVFWKNNMEVLDYLDLAGRSKGFELAIEMIQSYGMPVGKEVFNTCRWIGRFEERWRLFSGKDAHLLCRKSSFGLFPGIGSHLCHTNRATDGTIRQAIIDRFPRKGGGTIPQIGTSMAKGPLYDIRSSSKGSSKHTWQALAVAITAQDTITELQTEGLI